MKSRLLSKFVIICTLVLTIISTIVIPSNKVSASLTEVTQSTINLTNLIREDNTIRFTIPDSIKIKDITYERVTATRQLEVLDSATVFCYALKSTNA